MKKMDEAWGHKGLNVITAYTQFHELEIIQKHVDDIGFEYPVALDGFFDSRFTARLLCQVWVIGPDGKVAWTGIQGWEEAAVEELLKLEYAGLDLKNPDSDVKDAAAAFGTERYAEAYRLADEIAFGDGSDKAIEHAGLITQAVEDRIKELNNRVTVHEISGRFDKAIACLNELRKYEGVDDVPDVDAEVKRIKALDSYKTETEARLAYIDVRIKAWQGFVGIEDTNEATTQAAAGARELLKEFSAGNKGTAVAADAEELASEYEAWIEELKPAEAAGK